MSGYFSRIAKQSGVRFLNRGETRRGSMGDRAGRVMPLEREETVMVSAAETPIISTDERPVVRTTEPKQDVHAVAAPAERARRRSAATPEPVNETSPRESESQHSAPAVEEEVRLVDPDRPGSSGVRSESPAIAVSENTRVTIPPESGTSTQNPRRDEKRQTDTANSETPARDFFERTTEIIQGREAEPSTVQTILIQEVQEWIAAGRIPTEDIMPDVDDREQQQPDEPQSIIEPKPGVIRIGDRKPPDTSSDHVQELSASAAEPIKEQNFEISIGSISVVVDGEEPVVARPAPAATQPSAPSPASPRTSRLNRHYL